MKKTLSFCLIFLTSGLFAQSQTGNEILIKVDQNLTSDSKIITSTMIIHGRRSSRTIESKSWIEGTEKSFTEYLAPVREKGTKMLKLEEQLWTYSPSIDRIIQISGHMLRQSVMGSDLSYEDMMEDPVLHNLYSAKIVAEEKMKGFNCWILELTAKREDVAYHSRKIWVDKERYLPLREELFAKSGKLLKTTQIEGYLELKNRWYPKKMIFKDELKTGMGTEFVVESIEFDQKIPAYIFSKARLRK